MWLVRTGRDWATLPARLGLAVVMFPHGAQKAFGWFGGDGLAATVATMGEQGLPVIVPVLVVLAETLGSLALLVGLLGRLAALGIGLVMLGAIYLVHLPHGFFMNWTGRQAGEGFEYHLLALALTMVVMIKGSGALSVDRLLTRGREASVPADGRHVGAAAPDTDPSPAHPETPAAVR
jgi:putative oxidoreductase